MSLLTLMPSEASERKIRPSGHDSSLNLSIACDEDPLPRLRAARGLTRGGYHLPRVQMFADRESAVAPKFSRARAHTHTHTHIHARTSGSSCATSRSGGKRDIPEKTRRPEASYGTIPTCVNPRATPPRIEPSSPRWEESSLTITPPRPLTTPASVLGVTTLAEIEETIFVQLSPPFRSAVDNMYSSFLGTDLAPDITVCSERFPYWLDFRLESTLPGADWPAAFHHQCWNVRLRETEDPRENPPIRDIVRHDSHLRKILSDTAEDRTRCALEGDDQSNRSLPQKKMGWKITPLHSSPAHLLLPNVTSIMVQNCAAGCGCHRRCGRSDSSGSGVLQDVWELSSYCWSILRGEGGHPYVRAMREGQTYLRLRCGSSSRRREAQARFRSRISPRAPAPPTAGTWTNEGKREERGRNPMIRESGGQIRLYEVCMEQRRNEGARETGNPLENPPTCYIVRHDSHLRKSRIVPAGD
ncbi:hypothetical protein PR048_009578 [Dryococelus australis]|uniref:Uncharacterized protein n=1 Tax=Dryococelus australis TaxID=614101 RepID=A0ABQ9I091_9NEOP|nr:hypothetical protein PR048_009578 [Dryococelus australis]